MKYLRNLFVLFLLCLLVSAVGTEHSVLAATIPVDCKVDALIAAMVKAVKSVQPTTLELEAECVYKLEKIHNEGQDGDNGLPQVPADREVTINGNGAVIARKTHETPISSLVPSLTGERTSLSNAALQSVDASAPMFRFFQVNEGGKLSLNNLTLRDGLNWKNAQEEGGGAIANWGAVNIADCTFINNVAGCGGAVFHHGETPMRVYRSTFYFNAGER